MADTLVDKSVCEACGTGVREGATFCYNCGESIAVDAPPPPAILKPDPDLLNGRVSGGLRSMGLKEREPAPISIPQSRLEPPPAPSPSEVVSEPKKPDPPPMPERRRPPRARTRKIAEVEWVERSSISPAFFVAAVMLAILVILMISAALYLR